MEQQRCPSLTPPKKIKKSPFFQNATFLPFAEHIFIHLAFFLTFGSSFVTYPCLMSYFLRIWMFAVTALLLAEDFQYLLKIENAALEQRMAEEYGGCEDPTDSDGKQENEEEKKEEKKDENKNREIYALWDKDSQLAKNKFRNARFSFPCFSNELESPPPEF